MLRFSSLLPHREHYQPLASPREGAWLWQDRNTPLLRISAPTPDPWGQVWRVLPSRQDSKSDQARYPSRLILKLYPDTTGCTPIRIERELVKANFAYADYDRVAFWAFPTSPKLWVFYTFHKEA